MARDSRAAFACGTAAAFIVAAVVLPVVSRIAGLSLGLRVMEIVVGALTAIYLVWRALR